jgi:hypothetical protein
MEEQQEESLRGQEVKEEKLTLDEMYRSVLLDKNTTKMFNFNEGSKPCLLNPYPENQTLHFPKKSSLLI